MDVINEIIQQSAIGPTASWFRKLIISLFLTIVITLVSMLGILLVYGNQMHVSFGY